MKKKRLASLCLSALILAAFPVFSLRAAKYPPGVRWREIGGEGITVIFPVERSAEAAAALASARALTLGLASFWGFRPRARTRIVLGDFTDQANGFATFFPYNLVGVDLAEPPPDSEIAGGGEWLDRALAHELTHIYTMNAGAPVFRAGRSLFGSLPVFYPAAQLPPWVVEGLAVHGESRFSGDGRLNRAPYRLMLTAAGRSGLFPDWQRLAGMPAAWPGPNGKYLFGAGFMEFLAERSGAESLRRYVERFSSRLVAFGSSRDFKKIFGKPLGRLWEEYREGIAVARRAAPEPLTAGGFFNRYPCVRGKSSLAYYHRDYRARGAVSLLDLDSGTSRALFRMDALNALSCVDKEDKLLLSASEYFRAFSDFSDLYEFDVKKGRLARLSHGQRLSHPVRDENSRWLYCIQRRNNRCRLALFSMEKREARTISVSFAGLAQPSISPDGSRIAAAAKPAGGPWGIAVFLASGALHRFLAVKGSDLSQPRWQGNDRLFFIVSGKETSFLAQYSLDGDECWRLEDPHFAGLRQFDLSRDGLEVFFTYFSGRGEEIARRPTAWMPLSPMKISVATGIPEATPAPAATTPVRSRSYRPLRDLLPHWWSPALRAGGDEVQAGIVTGGQDALGIHAYSLEGCLGLESRRPNTLFRYVFDGFFPTLSLSLGDHVEYYRGSDTSQRTREMTLASLWPLRLRRRSQLHAYVDLHLEKRFLIDGESEFALGDMRNGFRLGMRLNSAREWYDSISPADGVTLAVQGAVQSAALGNELASHAIQADLRVYLPLFRPGVLALRLAAARNWEPASNYYDMGGVMAAGGLGSSHPFRLLRGFGSGRFFGNRGWQFNAECRLPLLRIEKAFLPAVSLDRLWFAAFFDAGRLARRSYVPPVAYSLGAEAVLRLGFSGLACTDLALGAAHGFGPERRWQVYLRTGRSF